MSRVWGVIAALAVAVGAAWTGGTGWRTLRPPEGGDVTPRALAVSEDGRTWYVGPGTGIFVSRGGRPWREASPAEWVRVLDIEAPSATTAYAATLGAGGRVYKTIDGGGAWARADRGIAQREDVYDLAAAPGVPAVLYAFAGGDGSESLLRSLNGGASWERRGALPGGERGSELVVDPASTDTVYVAARDGLYRSGDGGADWTRSTLGLSDPTRADVTAFALRPTTPRTLYAGTATAGVVKSVDGGLSWQLAGDGLPKRGADYETVQQITFDPLQQNVLYVLSGRFLPGRLSVSDDGGQTWQQPTDRVLRWLVPNPVRAGALVAASADGGLLRSNDRGGRWTANDAGFTAAQPSALVVDLRNARVVYAATWATGVRKSTDAAATWTPPDATVTGHAEVLAIAPRSPSIVYVGTPYDDGRGILRSSDSGSTWETVGGTDFSDVRALAVDPQSSTTLLAADSYGGIQRSIDGGRTWHDTLVDEPIDALAFDPTRPTIVYAGVSSSFNDLRGSGAYVSRKSGKLGTWERIDAGLGPQGSPPEVYDLAVTRVGGVFAATSSGVYERSRRAKRWTNVSRGLPARRAGATAPVLAVAVNPRTGTAYATTSLGTYLLTPGAKTANRSWRSAGTKAARQRGGELAFAADGSRLYLLDDHRLLRLDDPD